MLSLQENHHFEHNQLFHLLKDMIFILSCLISPHTKMPLIGTSYNVELKVCNAHKSKWTLKNLSSEKLSELVHSVRTTDAIRLN